MEGLLISSDVEVGAKIRTSKEAVHEVVPPAYFRVVKEFEPLGFNGGDETKPIFVNSDSTTWFEDGALFEVAFKPVSKSKDLFSQFFKASSLLDEWLLGFDHTILLAPVGSFNLAKYKGYEGIEQACIAGCNPDKNALIKDYNSEITNIARWKYRGMGGHIHMSLPYEDWEDSLHKYQQIILRTLVVFAGNVGVLASQNRDLELIRLQKFGHPGSYRTPIYPDGCYGFEYRAPSSSWLFTEESVELMFEAVERALTLSLLPEHSDERKLIDELYLEKSITAVRSQDKNLAEDILGIVGLL